ncbi:MAG: serine protein kinase RIO [Candidatus Thermoplasmatota archaeon]
MSSRDNDFLDEKILKKLDRQVQRISDRAGFDRKTEAEVFDKPTLHTLEKMISDRIIDIVDFPISTGKEGNIFRAVTPDDEFLAVKIYRVSTSTFKHISKYIVGDPRFEELHQNRRNLVYAWTQKEFKNLQLLDKAGVLAPKPIKSLNNVLLMEYIGTKERPAPLLKEIKINNPSEIFEEIVNYMALMYQEINLVHADLSPFNILMHNDKPYLIDLGQAVMLDHFNSDEFLRRDIHNIVSYFKKYNIKKDEDKIYKQVICK